MWCQARISAVQTYFGQSRFIWACRSVLVVSYLKITQIDLGSLKHVWTAEMVLRTTWQVPTRQ
ncbi:hypothetical protein RHMOL_Rhmol11G0273500 [Rhododendron molle]|uniref:Uncharacterized protein n=1 Tax=Rhododendron molle TaxID=49168 RepID=A0ACC0LXB3_RHOML|nr:hypothetical protein RHMOL_Rhmol11G0273500 [Rhododendron molle]